MNEETLVFDKKMLAFCGLYCAQCSFKLAHDENDRKHLANIPYQFEQKDLSSYHCEGCKGYCICGVCNIKPCALTKQIDSCADCDRFPCDHIQAFEQDGMPHHKDAIENLRNIRRYGVAQWFHTFIKPSLRCEHCGERQSWYYACATHEAMPIK